MQKIYSLFLTVIVSLPALNTNTPSHKTLSQLMEANELENRAQLEQVVQQVTQQITLDVLRRIARRRDLTPPPSFDVEQAQQLGILRETPPE